MQNQNQRQMSKKPKLIREIAETSQIQLAWDKLNKSNPLSYGLSGQTILDFGNNLNTNLASISRSLKNNSFKFSKTRAAVIPKNNSKKGKSDFRPLQIPEIKDRVVMKSIAISLENELNNVLLKGKKVSFAYQKGLGVKDAVIKLKGSFTGNGMVILKADIVNFFNAIDRDALLKEMVYPNLRDDSINKLISSALSQNVGGLDKLKKIRHAELFENTNVGIPQGNPISPLLSNVYLSTFDEFMKNENYNLIRYADDFLVTCSSKKEAYKVYNIVVKFLNEELDLHIHSINSSGKKTRIVNPLTDEFSFLSIAFDGKELYPVRKKVTSLKKKIKYLLWKKKQDKNICEIIIKAIDYWVSRYAYTNIELYFDELDEFLDKQLCKALKAQERVASKNDKVILTKKEKEDFGISTLSEVANKRRNLQKAKAK